MGPSSRTTIGASRVRSDPVGVYKQIRHIMQTIRHLCDSTLSSPTRSNDRQSVIEQVRQAAATARVLAQVGAASPKWLHADKSAFLIGHARSRGTHQTTCIGASESPYPSGVVIALFSGHPLLFPQLTPHICLRCFTFFID